MGPLKRPAEWRGSRVYLDTNVFVYALEGFAEYAPVLKELFDLIDRREIEAVTSELSLAEAVVKPMMNGDVETQTAYERAIMDAGSLRVQAVSRSVNAATIAKRHRLSIRRR